MSTDEVEVFLGDTVEDDAEFHVLNRLCADLAARGVPARVHANFYTKRRGRHAGCDSATTSSPVSWPPRTSCIARDRSLLVRNASRRPERRAPSRSSSPVRSRSLSPIPRSNR